MRTRKSIVIRHKGIIADPGESDFQQWWGQKPVARGMSERWWYREQKTTSRNLAVKGKTWEWKGLGVRDQWECGSRRKTSGAPRSKPRGAYTLLPLPQPSVIIWDGFLASSFSDSLLFAMLCKSLQGDKNETSICDFLKGKGWATISELSLYPQCLST